MAVKWNAPWLCLERGTWRQCAGGDNRDDGIGLGLIVGAGYDTIDVAAVGSNDDFDCRIGDER